MYLQRDEKMGKKGVEASIARENINSAAEILQLTSTGAVFHPVYCSELMSKMSALKLLNLFLLTN